MAESIFPIDKCKEAANNGIPYFKAISAPSFVI